MTKSWNLEDGVSEPTMSERWLSVRAELELEARLQRAEARLAEAEVAKLGYLALVCKQRDCLDFLENELHLDIGSVRESFGVLGSGSQP